MQCEKLWRFFCVVFLSFSLSVRAEDFPVDTSPKEGWVVFATDSYMPLLEVAIASLHTFSTRPVVAVGVNTDIPFSLEKYPRLIKKRIDVDLNARLCYFYKPQAILAAGLDYGVYFDADAIANIGCDRLFDEAHSVEEYPLLPKHEDDAYVSWEATEFFGVPKRTMHYVHCDVIVFSKKCLPFLKEWSEICLNYPHLGYPVWDETLMNVLLWKKGATRHLYTFDPYNAYFGNYLGLSNEAIAQPPYDKWFIFHGNKWVDRGWSMLEDLKRKHQISSSGNE